jgi:hypothetical protein
MDKFLAKLVFFIGKGKIQPIKGFIFLGKINLQNIQEVSAILAQKHPFFVASEAEFGEKEIL